MGTSMEILFSMCFLVKNLMGDIPILLLDYEEINKWNITIKFNLHSKFYKLELAIKMLQEDFELTTTIGPNDECIINTHFLHLRGEGIRSQ